MERFSVVLTPRPAAEAAPDEIAISAELLGRLGVQDGSAVRLRYGTRSARVRILESSALPPGAVRMDESLARQLEIGSRLRLTIFCPAPGTLALGPYVGLLVSDAKLKAVLGGRRDIVYCRYARYAREVGALLLFITPDSIDPSSMSVHGYLHAEDSAGACRWDQVTAPFPRVIYDRCFGQEGRAGAVRVRELATSVGAVVVNRPLKITKLAAFEALQNCPALSPYLPYTARLSLESLTHAMSTCTDLYLKPDALYKGKGVHRLLRHPDGWELRVREEWGNASRFLPASDDLPKELIGLFNPDVTYVIQEGLPLAEYFGNRFDFRSLVQKDGSGEWRLTGLVARLAPDGSVITSPRSGGQVAAADQALTHAFPNHTAQVTARIERVSLAIAQEIDRKLGPCAELGLDLGVTDDGQVKLIEVNGIPLRVSLERLKDPLVSERINRYPVHYAAYLDIEEVVPCEG